MAAVGVVEAAAADAPKADAPKAVPRADTLMAAVHRVGVRSVISPAHAVEAAAAEISCAVRSPSARHDFLSYPWSVGDPSPADFQRHSFLL